MNNDIVTLDFYNSSFYMRLNGQEYFTNSLEKFRSDIGYPYDNVNILCYEPGRNIFCLEKAGGLVESGAELEPIAWITSNLQDLIIKVANVAEAEAPVYTLEMERAIRFANTDWLMQRDQEERLLNRATSLNSAQIIDLLNYRQQLRDLTYNYAKDTPAIAVAWPINPIN